MPDSGTEAERQEESDVREYSQDDGSEEGKLR